MKSIFALGCVVVIAGISPHAQTGDTSSAPKSQSTTPHHSVSKSIHKTRAHRRVHKPFHRGQQKIDSQRALQIQEALIREHYLNGKPSGAWDDATQKALQKYQADNGWQSKTTPDSRALIKLGLGPDREHLLNPESAMTSQPQQNAVPVSSSAPAANGSSTTVLPQK